MSGFDKIAKLHGFSDAEDLHSHVSRADISTPEKMRAFKRWQKEDGSKKGSKETCG